MHEQRPSTSPGAHPVAHPQRVVPVQPHTAHASHVSHGPQTLQGAAHPAARSTAAATASLPVDDDLVVLDDDSIALDDGVATAPAAGSSVAGASKAGDGAASPTKKITFSADTMGRQRNWKRKPHFGGTGACRVKTFHGKCSDQGMEYLDDAINAFLDEHPDIEVKQVQSNVAMFDGKFKDFALIVNVWY